jgi:hypothetical protein
MSLTQFIRAINYVESLEQITEDGRECNTYYTRNGKEKEDGIHGL